MNFNIIVAVDNSYGIGKCNTIPWKNTDEGRHDMKMFKKLTSAGDLPILIMGRNTYYSCPDLPGRKKVLISSSGDFTCVYDAIKYYQGHPIWVCGGRSIYLEALSLGPTNIYISHIPGDYNCDVFVKEFSEFKHLCIDIS
jgi:dihydrofolate reductase